MKAEQKASLTAHPVVVWESRPKQQTSEIIPFPETRPGSQRGQGIVEQEATASVWQVGAETNPVIVTEVSSGFAKGRATGAASQAIRMSVAA